MPVISKVPVSKGSQGKFTLNKTDLATLATAQGLPSHFQNPLNWKSVTIFFKDPSLGQRKFVRFNCQKPEPWLGLFKLSASASDLFEVEQIVINDLDGASRVVNRANIPVEDFDISLVVTPPAGIATPARFHAEIVGFNQVEVSWDAVEGATEYHILWGTSSGVYSQSIGTEETIETINVPVGTKYFAVVAVDSSLNESAPSNEVMLKVISSAAADLSIYNITADSMTASMDVWSGDGAEEYEVSWGNAIGQNLGSHTFLQEDSNDNFVFTGMSGDPVYFRVTYSNSTGSITRDFGPYNLASSGGGSEVDPNTPTNVQGSGGVGTITLSWDAVEGAEQYNIYRDGSFWSIVNAPETTYFEEGSDAGTYQYTVASAKDGGNTVSAQSAPVEIVVS